MQAKLLNGEFIGTQIVWKHPSGPRVSDNITMVQHKKNGNVWIRHGRNNRMWEFRPYDELEPYGGEE